MPGGRMIDLTYDEQELHVRGWTEWSKGNWMPPADWPGERRPMAVAVALRLVEERESVDALESLKERKV